MKDTFNGDNAKLIDSIRALLALDASGSLVPHGVGGHARTLLESAAVRLESRQHTVTVAVDVGAAQVALDAALAERDEADRRAGAAERREQLSLTSERNRASWLTEAKKRAGYDDIISFDDVFNDLLKIRVAARALEKAIPAGEGVVPFWVELSVLRDALEDK